MSKDGFNIKEGVLNVLKSLLKNEEFIDAVIDLILGKPGAGKEAKSMLEKESYSQTLNEAVAIHRVMKQRLNEEDKPEEGVKEEGGVKRFFKMLWELRKKSAKFKRKVTWKAIKKPGVLVALIRLIATEGTDAVALKTVLVAFGEAAVEVAAEDEEMKLAVNEVAMAKRLRNTLSRSVLSEEFEDRYGGRMPVNVYTGRFQPFHLGHLSNLEEAAKRGLRTVICPVMAGKTPKSQAAHPFNGEIEDEMFNRIKSTYGDLIADIIPISRPSLDNWVEAIRERGMEPITWTTGIDRKPAYEGMIERYGKDFNLVDTFEVIGLDKDIDAEGGSADDTGKISGTAIRQCLMDGNEDGFRAQMPRCLWDMYDVMRDVLVNPNSEVEVKQYGELSEVCGIRGFRAPINEEIGNFIRKNRKL